MKEGSRTFRESLLARGAPPQEHCHMEIIEERQRRLYEALTRLTDKQIYELENFVKDLNSRATNFQRVAGRLRSPPQTGTQRQT